MTPAVFLDRDGTLIEEVGYLDRLERLALFPYSIDAVRLLNRAGFHVVVVTNQPGVAHGLIEEQFLAEAHRYLDAKMTAAGARVDAYYYCPHHPDAAVEMYRMKCECRKPGPGMIRNAVRDLDLDIRQSFVVGDHWVDVGMGKAAGVTSILVRTGHGKAEEVRPRDGITADVIVANLIEAATWILRHNANP